MNEVNRWLCSWRRLAFVCAFALLLQACAGKHMPVPADAELDRREQQLMNIERWSFNGKLGVKAPGESASVYITWHQQQQDYVIGLQGPLGQGSAKMSGTERGAVLEQDGERYQSDDAESLVFQRFGWQLPVQQLKYWLRALPAPASADERQLERDEQGLLLSQQQAGWSLQYSQYHWVGEQALPGKIKAESAALGVRLILVINQWQLEANTLGASQ
ncbi:lipoprotein insertase outer membrane protein LolB [Simiduia curdlanivorans]|uniref:Outer-membrane lipoprotein LolB n=1 Tax=Simiduia curdlanivorans TaxID=1492769 RepID=A0ABV8V6S9_9GAMM|nr:lipoprotein insertase outer membrane protein LolB [Simiduia curdlanivorans]MDN3638399.1 lipoprotein insertase outer membrane protein LolB [Simiduia curdlanivorans]